MADESDEVREPSPKRRKLHECDQLLALGALVEASTELGEAARTLKQVKIDVGDNVVSAFWISRVKELNIGLSETVHTMGRAISEWKRVYKQAGRGSETATSSPTAPSTPPDHPAGPPIVRIEIPVELAGAACEQLLSGRHHCGRQRK